MQNMYSTPLRYKNFNGVEKHTTLHFHVTPVEFTDWMMDHPDVSARLVDDFTEVQEQIEGNPDGEATTSQKTTMLKLVRILAEISYGKPDEDGEVFHKGDIEKFRYSAAYDAFRMFLFEHPKELVSFISTLLSQEVLSDFSARMSAIVAEDDGEQPAVQQSSLPVRKDPKDMTHEELVAAMQARNQQ